MEGLSYWESTVVGQKYRDKTTLGSLSKRRLK